MEPSVRRLQVALLTLGEIGCAALVAIDAAMLTGDALGVRYLRGFGLVYAVLSATALVALGLGLLSLYQRRRTRGALVAAFLCAALVGSSSYARWTAGGAMAMVPLSGWEVLIQLSDWSGVPSLHLAAGVALLWSAALGWAALGLRRSHGAGLCLQIGLALLVAPLLFLIRFWSVHYFPWPSATARTAETLFFGGLRLWGVLCLGFLLRRDRPM